MRKLPPLLIAIFVMFTHLNGEPVAVNPESVASVHPTAPGYPVGTMIDLRSRAAIDAGIAAGHLKVINLPHRIPVAWVYVTGWVTRDGTVNFREDVYKHDDNTETEAR